MFHFFSRILGFAPPQLTNVHCPARRVRLVLEELENRLTPAALNPYVVTTTADDPNVPLAGQTTLRDAINAANTSNNQTITFAPGVSGDIQLQAALPALAKNITIDGPTGNASIAVLGSGSNAPTSYRVFTVNAGTTCTIENLEIANGYLTTASGGGILNQGNLTLVDDYVQFNQAVGEPNCGGGIYNASGAKLLVESSDIDQNSSGYQGGGIANNGTVTVVNSQIYSNQSSEGGGLSNGTQSILDINCGSQIYYNTASHDGGGIFNSGKSVSMSGGMVAYNSATDHGGGIYTYSGSLTLSGGVTIGSENNADEGGGLYLAAKSTTTFNGCTISGNQATTGVGYYEEYGARINPLDIYNPDGFYAQPPP